MKLTWTRKRLTLRHPWTLARGTSVSKEYWFVELEHDGITGLGEAAHNPRYGESLDSVEAFFSEAAPFLSTCSPGSFSQVSEQLDPMAGGQFAAKAAIDMALHDWAGKSIGVPLHRMLGIDPVGIPATAYSIGIGTGEEIRNKVRDAEEFSVLKIKLGGENDREIINAVRSVTDKPIRVDANEGWTDRELALKNIDWLSENQVEFVEQPLPAGRLDDMAWLKERSPLRLFADEDVRRPEHLLDLHGVYDGINIKLMKAGGIQPALRLIHGCRCLGMEIMLGCMIESSLGITAAAQLAPLVDYVDLDGNLLIAHDPFEGVSCSRGLLTLPNGSGLGVRPAGGGDMQ